MSLKLRYDIFGTDVLKDAKMEGKYEFPRIDGVYIDEFSKRVVPFDRIGSDIHKGDWLHFFVHDKRFHQFLGRREVYRSRLKDIDGVIGADNSMYRDLPLAEQIHSCYLNRCIDYYFCHNGKSVIPNVSWGDWRSYEFCCDGIAMNSTIAMSSYGCCRSRSEKFRFEDGFVFVVGRLKPYSILIYGAIWPSLHEIAQVSNVNLIQIPSWRSDKLAKEVKNG